MIPTAVIGVGQTHHKSRRRDVSIGGLVREAVFRALEDAHLTMADIDAVVLGKAPDLFEGVMKPELYLSDALGAVGKPMFRVHTAGSVGGTTAIVAASHVQAGKHKTVLAVAFEKQSESEAMWALSLPIPFTPPLHAGAQRKPGVENLADRHAASDLPDSSDVVGVRVCEDSHVERAHAPLAQPAPNRRGAGCLPRVNEPVSVVRLDEHAVCLADIHQQKAKVSGLDAIGRAARKRRAHQRRQ